MTLDHARRKQLFNRWHRRIGITVALWLLVLAFSGVLINHANDWSLDQTGLPENVQSLFYPLTMADEFDETAFISWERLLLDLHAGRFLGPLAAWFSDIMASLIIILSLSGIWLWWKNYRRSK